MTTFSEAFALEVMTGRLFWKVPPKNHAQRVGDEAGFINIGKGKNKTYWQIRLNGKTYKRSRVIFYMMHGKWPDPCVDHVNGNSLDDRPENLRECSIADNAKNISYRKNKESGLPRGVTNWKGRFAARVTCHGNINFLGYFDTVENANMACISKRLELFGDFS